MLVHFRDASGAPVLIDVTATIRHPDFHADAAAKAGALDRPRPCRDEKRPAGALLGRRALAGGAPPGPGEKAIGAGFGVAEERQAKTGGTLRAARLAVREPRSSVLLWLEGADGEGGACQGDSGGPIFSEDGRLLVAIIAWTAGQVRPEMRHAHPGRSGRPARRMDRHRDAAASGGRRRIVAAVAHRGSFSSPDIWRTRRLTTTAVSDRGYRSRSGQTIFVFYNRFDL